MVENVSKGIFKVGGGSWFGAVPVCSDESDCNVYLIDAGDSLIMVDSSGRGGTEAVKKNIAEAGYKPEQITDIIITHSHFDHVETIHKWQTDYDVKVHMGSIGVEHLNRGDYRLVGYHIGESDYIFEPFKVDAIINPDTQFKIGSIEFTAYPFPGHTLDCMIFTFELEGSILWICGDIVFGKNHTGKLGHIGLQNMLWKSNLYDYKDSFTKMLEMDTPDFLLPGHGQAVSGKKETKKAMTASFKTVKELISYKHLMHFDISYLMKD